MACCPFHDDHHPSLKLDKRFHCFGCGEDGDVIDLTARLFRLTPKEAAEKLIADFGNGKSIPDSSTPPKPPDPDRRCHDVLLELELLLRKQKRRTAPHSIADPITTEYAQNCQMYDFVVCLADLLSGGTEREKQDCLNYLTGGVLDRYEQGLKKGVVEYETIF